VIRRILITLPLILGFASQAAAQAISPVNTVHAGYCPSGKVVSGMSPSGPICVTGGGGGGGATPGGGPGAIQYNAGSSIFGGVNITGLVKGNGSSAPSAYAGTGACPANEWMTALSGAGVSTCAVISFSNLSGTISSAQQLPINAGPNQTNDYNAQGFNFSNLGIVTAQSLFGSANNTIQVTNPPKTINGVAVTAAKCDGSTDDTVAINGIILADGGGTGGIGSCTGLGAHNIVEPIRLPAGTACMHHAPIEIPSANYDFGGPSGANITGANNVGLTQNYIGPAVILAACGGSVSTSIAGPFASTTAYNPDFGANVINYDDILNSPNHNLTGITATGGFDASLWVYVTSYTAVGGGAVFGPSITDLAKLDGQTQNPSLSFNIDNTPQFTVHTNFNGGGQTFNLTGANLPTAGAWHFVRLDENAGTLRVIVDGSTKATATGITGNLEQNTFETWCGDGSSATVYPCGGYSNANPPVYYWGVDIENAPASNIAFVPSGPVSPTSHTLFLDNYDTPATHQYNQGYSGAVALGSPNVFLPMTSTSGNSLVPAYSHLHDFVVCENSGSNCDGLETQWAFYSEFDHLSGTDDQVGISNQESYLSHQHDNLFGGANVAYVDFGSNESEWDNNQSGTVRLVHSFTQSEGLVLHETTQSNGHLYFGTYEQQGHFDWQFFFDDEESANPTKIAEHVIDNNFGSDTYVGSEDALPNNSNDFDVINGGQLPVVTEAYINTGNSTGDIFHFDGSSYPTAAIIQHLILNGTIGALSNISADVTETLNYISVPFSSLPGTCSLGDTALVSGASSAVGTCTSGSALTLAICQTGNVWLCL
jgi:hypothetical protein